MTNQTIWRKYGKRDTSVLKQSEKLAHLPEEILQILMMRGFDTIEKATAHLYTSLKEIHSPFLMKDMAKGVEIMQDAIEKEENIVIFSDYDTDGVTSGATLLLGLKKAGAKVNVWTNNRFVQGYGISVAGVDSMLEKFPDTQLIITTDNGISAIEGIAYAKSLGMRVIVTDHHDPALEAPPADAIIDPKQVDCEYPFKGLCGAGVAYKFLQALYWKMDLNLNDVDELLDIVALGTVADIVPLVDENRVIVKEGLKRIQSEDRPAFRIMRQITGVSKVDSQTLGFKYAPMINSLSRLTGDPLAAIEMFIEEDEEIITKTVIGNNEMNERRKQMTEEQTALADALVQEKGLQIVNVIYHESFHEGLVGLIASKLKEKYHRPFFVFAEGERKGELKGSGRGIDGFHLKKALDTVADLLIKYGGHTKAAGLSIYTANLAEFEKRLNELAESEMDKEDLIKKIYVEIALTPDDLTVELTESLEMLEPYGEAFQKPIVGLSNFDIERVFQMGQNKNHLKLVSSSGIPLIMWSGVDYFEELNNPTVVKAIGFPSLNIWNGETTVQFIVNSSDLRVQ